MLRTVLGCLVVLAWTQTGFADQAPVEVLEKYLQAGTLPAGEAALGELVKKSPQDPQARFALGTIQFLRAVEKLGQRLYQYGFMQTNWVLRAGIFLGDQLPLPQNPHPEPIDYQTARQIYQEFASNLKTAEATLAHVPALARGRGEDVKLPLHFGLIRLDLDGDGKATDAETLWKIYSQVNRRAGVEEAVARNFVITFDLGDVQWLRGYCHLLMGLTETGLAYDSHELFDCCAHLFFANPKVPYRFLLAPGNREVFSFENIIDTVAVIHLIKFPVTEPKRMQTALEHWETMIELSLKSWDLIDAEKDDDTEWIPNPRQTGVIPNVKVTAEMIETWKEFLAEARNILQGKALIPFWRSDLEHGVNFRLVFTAPRPFDLIMWIQGTGAAPFLQKGNITQPEIWQRLSRVFQGEFIGFAMWFN